MPTWTRKPQETEGSHYFDAKAVMTTALSHDISPAELCALKGQLDAAVEENDGLDYLQVFECDDGRVAWVIDDTSHVTWLRPDDY